MTGTLECIRKATRAAGNSNLSLPRWQHCGNQNRLASQDLENFGDNRAMIRCMPVLQVADIKRSEKFYREKLGFQSHGTWGEVPDFGIVQRGRVTIALDSSRDGEPTPTNQYWAAYIYVEDAGALWEQVRRDGVEVARGPEDMFYGLRDFDVRDPDGHILAVGHDLVPGDLEPGLMN